MQNYIVQGIWRYQKPRNKCALNVDSNIIELKMKSLGLFYVQKEKHWSWQKQHDFKMYAKY